MEIYKSESWNSLLDKHKKPLVPVSDPIILKTCALLIENAPNDSKVIEITNWMLKQKGFPPQACQDWILLIDKIKNADEQPIVYPLYDDLKNWMALQKN